MPSSTAAVDEHEAITPLVPDRVTTTDGLIALGVTPDGVRAQIAGGRWRRHGKAVVLHNGPLTARQLDRVAMVNAGPRVLLTAFTGLELLGLTGWRREARHLLVPTGARVRKLPGVPVRVHKVVKWSDVEVSARSFRIHDAPAAAVVAAGVTTRPRTACGLLAALVQQRICTVDSLRDRVVATPNLRHRALLMAVLGDIGMGAEALSEIDFARLCREAGLPPPVRQVVRVEPDGRRRYLDAEWIRRDGKRVVAEVDGAMHLAAPRWWDDQLRQNEVTISESLVLRFPSPVVRERDPVVADQLRRIGVGW